MVFVLVFCYVTMADQLELTATAMAVLKALASTFRGMSKKCIAQYASKELDFEVHVRNDLDRLLPKMRDAGLISLDKQTWHITEDGRGAIAEVPHEKAQVISFAISCLARVLIIFRF